MKSFSAIVGMAMRDLAYLADYICKLRIDLN